MPKDDGSIRICGDYKVTINPHLKVDQYPLPKPDDLFATLAGGTVFSKLDLASAYQQVVLDEESRELVTINTHQGLYQYTRLPFGVASAPAIFQNVMDQVLHGLPSAGAFLDDMIVKGKDEEDRLSNLEGVLKRLLDHGFRLKKRKCAFSEPSVVYLGFKVDKSGLSPTSSKTEEAINSAPRPENVSQLRSFLGLVNYYGRFFANLFTVTQPLNKLLRKGRRWHFMVKKL
eukprot:m.300289 g.300289  ORF g.300289 m.300289 type:complete len:230 (+) comp40793_c0_seq1:810-1499(+)